MHAPRKGKYTGVSPRHKLNTFGKAHHLLAREVGCMGKVLTAHGVKEACDWKRAVRRASPIRCGDCQCVFTSKNGCSH